MTIRCGLKCPTFAVFLVDKRLCFGSVRDLQVRGVPFDSAAGTVGNRTEKNRFGQRAGVVEIAGRGAARLDRFDPFAVMADRLRNYRLGPLEASEFFLWQQDVLVV